MIPPGAVRDFRTLLGAERARFEADGRGEWKSSICGGRRRVLGVLLPRTDSELCKAVSIARRYGTPLYPISTGKNWGLGSDLPVRDGHVVVDLRLMNRILSFDPRTGIIEVQPGVTQEQVALFLRRRRARFFLNVTGSTKSSSLVGNALERGVAHYGCRAAEIVSLDVVLGTGTKLRAGGGAFRFSRAGRSYPYGIGPDLRGVFFQSGLGIVTAAAFQLRPLRATVGVVSIEKRAGVPLPRFVERLAALRREGWLPSNLHLSNRSRRLSVLTPLYARSASLPMEQAEREVRRKIRSAWAATSSFQGEREEILRDVEKLRRSLKPLAQVDVRFQEDLDAPSQDSSWMRATRGPFLHACGVPSDDAILSLGFERRQGAFEALERTDIGTLFVVPLLPFRGGDVQRVLELVGKLFRARGFRPYVTFNLVEEWNLEAVINLVFDRRDAGEARRAHQCVRQAFRKLLEAGYPPQRMSIYQMGASGLMEPGHRQAVRALKDVFDPDRILARGRYG